MDSIVIFGGVQVYIFDQDEQTHISDNFNDLVLRTTRMVGVSGGFDELGSGPAPRSVGNVRFEGWLQADTRAQMSESLRLLGLMSSLGVAPLVKQPMDTSLPTRYCLARVNTISYAQSAVRLPRQQIKIIANFNVQNPGWRGAGTTGGIWDNQTIWDDDTIWDGEDVSQVVGGLVTEYTITPGGNALTYPTISFLCGVGETASQLKIQRLVGGAVIDEVHYDTTLVANDELVIATEARTVKLNGANAYGSAFGNRTVAWFALRPDVANSIRVKMGLPTDAGTIAINYEEIHV